MGEAREKEKGRREGGGKGKERIQNSILECGGGLNNKDRDFWRELGEWDVKILLKT